MVLLKSFTLPVAIRTKSVFAVLTKTLIPELTAIIASSVDTYLKKI